MSTRAIFEIAQPDAVIKSVFPLHIIAAGATQFTFKAYME
jgi:hypothetical protein